MSDETEATLTLPLTPLEHGALLALVGLAVAVMQHDAPTVNQFGQALSQPGLEGVCKALVERLSALPTQGDA